MRGIAPSNVRKSAIANDSSGGIFKKRLPSGTLNFLEKSTSWFSVGCFDPSIHAEYIPPTSAGKRDRLIAHSKRAGCTFTRTDTEIFRHSAKHEMNFNKNSGIVHSSIVKRESRADKNPFDFFTALPTMGSKFWWGVVSRI